MFSKAKKVCGILIEDSGISTIANMSCGLTASLILENAVVPALQTSMPACSYSSANDNADVEASSETTAY